jgi:hypothetical protein
MVPLMAIAMAGASNGEGDTKEVRAEEIIAKIEGGQPVEYDRVIVVGDLNISRIHLPENGKRAVAVPVQIRYSEFQGEVNFEGAGFSEPVNFEGSLFCRNAFFIGAFFGAGASFEGVSFDRDASFQEARFGGDANFNKARFRGDAIFYEDAFSGEARFYQARFNGDSNFNKVKFGEDAYFDGAQFSRVANFGGAQASKDASFFQAEFGWNAIFSDTVFSGTTYFEGAQFRRYASFEGAQFRRYASFGGASFSGDANFKGAQFDGDAYFMEAKFDGKLTLNNVRFSSIQIKWDTINDHLIYNEAIYLSLIKNFETLGYFRDADNCYYRYRQENQAREPSIGSKLLDILAWISCGYGVRPVHTFALSLLVTLLFGILFWAAKAIPRSEDGNDKPIERNIQCFVNSLYFSALAFVTPHASVQYRPAGRWRYVVLIEHILGWLLMALFLVTLGKVMIR